MQNLWSMLINLSMVISPYVFVGLDTDTNKTIQKEIIISRIFYCVEQIYQVSKDSFCSKSNNRNIVEPRVLCANMLLKYTDLRQHEIGKMLGVDRTNIIRYRDITSMYIDSEIKECEKLFKTLTIK